MEINGMNLVTGASLVKLINKIRANSGKLADDIHLAAVSVLAEIEKELDKTGAPNVDRIRQLLLNVHVSNRRKALGEWFRVYAPVTVAWAKDGSLSVKMLKGALAKSHPGFDIEGAAAIPYWDMTEEKVPGPVDFIKMIQNMQRKMEKALKGEADSKQSPDSIERALGGLGAVLASLEA